MQPPSGGCVLKLLILPGFSLSYLQPPSGGCVLKQGDVEISNTQKKGSRLRAAVC